MITTDDPITCAEYAMENDLLNTLGWKRLRKFARNKEKLDKMIKQARLRRICHDPIYKFGIRVPRDSHEARFLEQKEGHTNGEMQKRLKSNNYLIIRLLKT